MRAKDAKGKEKGKEDIRFRLTPKEKSFFDWCCTVLQLSHQEAMHQALQLWFNQLNHEKLADAIASYQTRLSEMSDKADKAEVNDVEMQSFVQLLKIIKANAKNFVNWEQSLIDAGHDPQIIKEQNLAEILLGIELGNFPEFWHLSLIESLNCDLTASHLQDIYQYERKKRLIKLSQASL